MMNRLKPRCCAGLLGLVMASCSHVSQDASTPISSSETRLIEETLTDYIEGTSLGTPDQLRSAFHPDFNLYAVNPDNSLRIWSGQDYISDFKVGESNNRVGKILSIDFEQDVAVAKAEVTIPGSRVFTDYFLLVKYEDQWRIIHKSYTSRPIDETLK
ncbi:nuclear transport factor 2 family protein [Erythrobacter crassostreae]|uniref:Nuclear transport factor 2 family protein n=1 Tax=Erythrobacter crassostreae TaxID=2828328 RepID=A0A9X1JKI7_9SPHN|nr:nuclear transport factor 2 family protein [Erythrobacter crassostrea]MBV7259001.1 nuclear transport factor 2 family protein [Erythrobacter crassostrea]